MAELLANYKMPDQPLRHEDQRLWQRSATSQQARVSFVGPTVLR